MKKIKRILAVMLCLCMAMSILPVGASAADAKTEVSVTFTESNPGGYANTATWTLSVNQAGTVNLRDAKNGRMEVTCKDNNWFAYDMGTLEAGYYDGIFSWWQTKAGGVFDFYVVPKGDVNAINAELASEIKPFTTLNGNASANAAADTKMSTEMVYLPENGEYMLVGRRSSSVENTNVYIYLTDFNMKKICNGLNDFNDKVSIDFTDTSAAASNIDNGSWLVSRTGYATLTPKTDSTPNNGVDNRHLEFNIRPETTRFIAFDIGIVANGDYKGKINYASLIDTGTSGEYNIYLVKTNAAFVAEQGSANAISYIVNGLNPEWEVGDKFNIEKINFLAQSGSYWNTAEFEAHGLTAGKYYLVVMPTYTDAIRYGNFQGFEMVPADFEYATAGDKADEAGAALFGENYAYIRKDGNDWVVNFFGGVKETKGYTEVGFKVTYNDDKTKEQGNEKVYSSLNIGGQNIAASEFGADVKFIFSEEITLSDIDASKGIEFVAYAIDENDNYVYGNTYTAVIE